MDLTPIPIPLVEYCHLVFDNYHYNKEYHHFGQKCISQNLKWGVSMMLPTANICDSTIAEELYWFSGKWNIVI